MKRTCNFKGIKHNYKVHGELFTSEKTFKGLAVELWKNQIPLNANTEKSIELSHKGKTRR